METIGNIMTFIIRLESLGRLYFLVLLVYRDDKRTLVVIVPTLIFTQPNLTL